MGIARSTQDYAGDALRAAANSATDAATVLAQILETRDAADRAEAAAARAEAALEEIRRLVGGSGS